MVEKLLTVGFHHRSRTLPGMTRFGGAHPPKNPQPPNAASLLPQNSLNTIIDLRLYGREGRRRKFGVISTCITNGTAGHGNPKFRLELQVQVLRSCSWLASPPLTVAARSLRPSPRTYMYRRAIYITGDIKWFLVNVFSPHGTLYTWVFWIRNI